MDTSARRTWHLATAICLLWSGAACSDDAAEPPAEMADAGRHVERGAAPDRDGAAIELDSGVSSASAGPRVRTAAGRTLYVRPRHEIGRLIEPQHVAMMNAMMRETLRIGTAQRAQLPGWPAAGKTGTSQDFRDAWFVGYTAHLVTGVWLGNDDSSPTRKATGGGLPVDIWSRVMKVAHQGVAVAELPGIIGSAPVVAAIPPASIGSGPAPMFAQDSSRPQPVANRGLDGWFLDKLFGKR